MKETELGELVIEWLKTERPDWEIFQEIRPSGSGHIADIVCLNKEDHVWVIELKTTLNLAVIRQAYWWDVDYRSVAVVGAKRPATQEERHWWYQHMRFKMDIGTLVAGTGFDEKMFIREKYSPPRKGLGYVGSREKDKIIEICRSGKTEGFGTAGGQGGGHWTPYKESMISVKEYIKSHPGCKASDIVSALGKLHYSSDHSARTNLAKNLILVEHNWCEIKKRGSLDTFYYKEGK